MDRMGKKSIVKLMSNYGSLQNYCKYAEYFILCLIDFRDTVCPTCKEHSVHILVHRLLHPILCVTPEFHNPETITSSRI